MNNSWLVPFLGFSFSFQDSVFNIKVEDEKFVTKSGSEIPFGSTPADDTLNIISEFHLIDSNGNYQKCLFVAVKGGMFPYFYLRFYDDSLSFTENLLSDWYELELA